MNWEKSKSLTPLKRDFLRAFFADETRFFLTGGSALGIFYLDHRLSYDLDFFTCDENIDWHGIDGLIHRITDAMGAQVEQVTASPSFYRYRLQRDGKTEVIDLVIEHAPQIDQEKAVFDTICVDTLREIAVNKVCTVIGRCEDKDVLDLYFLAEQGFDVVTLLKDAAKKEGGIGPATLSYVLAGAELKELPDYLLTEVSLDAVNEFIEDLRSRLGESAFPG